MTTFPDPESMSPESSFFTEELEISLRKTIAPIIPEKITAHFINGYTDDVREGLRC
jgi:hypothetical protein